MDKAGEPTLPCLSCDIIIQAAIQKLLRGAALRLPFDLCRLPIVSRTGALSISIFEKRGNNEKNYQQGIHWLFYHQSDCLSGGGGFPAACRFLDHRADPPGIHLNSGTISRLAGAPDPAGENVPADHAVLSDQRPGSGRAVFRSDRYLDPALSLDHTEPDRGIYFRNVCVAGSLADDVPVSKSGAAEMNSIHSVLIDLCYDVNQHES